MENIPDLKLHNALTLYQIALPEQDATLGPVKFGVVYPEVGTKSSFPSKMEPSVPHLANQYLTLIICFK